MHTPHQTIGLLGGTFDPIHIGHLRMALEAHEVLHLASVHLIPCYQPVHRHTPVASPKHRLEMVKLATADEPALYVDAREMQRQTPNYTITTLEDIRKERPNQSLCLLIGLDAFLDLPTWHRFEEILHVAHIVVAHRPAFSLSPNDRLSGFLHTYLRHETAYIHDHPAGGLFLLPIPALDISASMIRKQIAMRANPRYLLPDSVYHYIQQHGIYNK